MYNYHQQPVQVNASAAQNSLALVPVNANGSANFVKIETENGTFAQEETGGHMMKKLQEDLKEQGLVIRKHEDNIKFLKEEENSLNDTILDLQVNLSTYHTTSGPMIDLSNIETAEEDTIQHRLKHTNSAAGIVYQLKAHHSTQGSQLPLTKGLLGIVATLGKVDDANLSRRLSEYLGTESMLAVVCKTLDSVKAIESYNKEGSVNKNSGLHGLGASIGRAIDGRFLVICLECLRPYVNKIVADDPQRRLDIPKPRLPDGEIPHGFMGYAVNAIEIDRENLMYVTPDGYGLRETLFHHLFSRVQIYETKKDMHEALPCIIDGALSLDGGVIRRRIHVFGNVEEAYVNFAKTCRSPSLPTDYYAIESQIKKIDLQKNLVLEDLHREKELLNQAKLKFDEKKQELLRFIAHSSNSF